MDQEQAIIVIGGSNIDIQGAPDANFIARDSNPGRVDYSCGGVGRNIAENLARLSVPVYLISVVGNDSPGQTLLSRTGKAGVHIKHTKIVKGKNTSTYLFILDENRDMVAAVSDMSLIEEINPVYLEEKSGLLQQAAALVLDTNLSQASLAYIFEHYAGKKIIVDPVSTTKAEKIKNYLHQVDILTLNRLEAEQLSNLEIKTAHSLKQAGEWFLQQGVKEVFINGGENGIFACHQAGKMQIKAPPVRMLNATGAGDAVTAALVYGSLKAWNLEHRIRFALAAAALTITCSQTNHPGLSDPLITNYMKEHCYAGKLPAH